MSDNTQGVKPIFTFTICNGEHNDEYKFFSNSDGIESEDTGAGASWSDVLAALNKVRGNTECDCIIGVCGDTSDYQDSSFEVAKSSSETTKRGHSTPWFTPHNFCHECGADVRSISAKVNEQFYIR